MSEIDDIRELVEQQERDEELDDDVEEIDLLGVDQERLDENFDFGDARPWGYGY